MRIVEISDANFDDFIAFLASSQGSSPASLRHKYGYKWKYRANNYGFGLVDADQLVGVIGCIYSTREFSGCTYDLCNICDWYVDPLYRQHSVRLLLEILRQPDLTVTNFTPNRKALQVCQALGFKVLDETLIVAPLPFYALSPVRRSKPTIIDDRQAIRSKLSWPSRAVFEDLMDARECSHLLIRDGTRESYCVFRKDRRRGMPLAVLLHTTDSRLLTAAMRDLSQWLMRNYHTLLMVAESRTLTPGLRASIRVKDPRPKLYRSRSLTAGQIDLLYSELTR